MLALLKPAELFTNGSRTSLSRSGPRIGPSRHLVSIKLIKRYDLAQRPPGNVSAGLKEKNTTLLK